MFQLEIAETPLFDGDAENVVGFVTTCKLYLRIKRREGIVE